MSTIINEINSKQIFNQLNKEKILISDINIIISDYLNTSINPLRIVQLCESLDKIEKYSIAQDYVITREQSLNNPYFRVKEEINDPYTIKNFDKNELILFNEYFKLIPTMKMCLLKGLSHEDLLKWEFIVGISNENPDPVKVEEIKNVYEEKVPSRKFNYSDGYIKYHELNDKIFKEGVINLNTILKFLHTMNEIELKDDKIYFTFKGDTVPTRETRPIKNDTQAEFFRISYSLTDEILEESDLTNDVISKIKEGRKLFIKGINKYFGYTPPLDYLDLEGEILVNIFDYESLYNGSLSKGIVTDNFIEFFKSLYGKKALNYLDEFRNKKGHFPQ